MKNPQRQFQYMSALIVALLVGNAWTAAHASQPSSTVGVPQTLRDVILPGSELEPVPASDDRAPLVLRLAAVHRHGSAYRYDIVVYGLESGTYDLTQFLQRKDGSSTQDLPPLNVRVQSMLPPGQIEPTSLPTGELPRIGGYRTLLIVTATIWTLLLFALLFLGRFRARRTAERDPSPPRSLADQLRPLVESAIEGRASSAQLASLEQALLAYWRRKLGIELLSPAAAIEALKRHPEASQLVLQLEEWLHKPDSKKDVDLDRLLRPYRNLPPELPSIPPERPNLARESTR